MTYASKRYRDAVLTSPISQSEMASLVGLSVVVLNRVIHRRERVRHGELRHTQIGRMLGLSDDEIFDLPASTVASLAVSGGQVDGANG